MRIFKLFFWLVVLCLLALVIARGVAFVRETDRVMDVLPPQGAQVATPMGVMYRQTWGTQGDPVVLLIHGTGAWSGLWAETGEALAKAGYFAVAVDMPPFGFSDRDPKQRYDRVTQSQRIVAFAKTLPQPPLLVAHSFGAAAGAEALVTVPRTFRGAVIVSGAIGLGKGADAGGVPLLLKPQVMREMVVAATATNPLMTRTLLGMMVHNTDAATAERAAILQRPMTLRGSTAAFAAWLPSLLGPEGAVHSITVPPYAGLPIPVRVIWGDKDTITPVEQAWSLSTALAQEAPVILPNVGHIPQIEAPAAFQKALIEALDGITGRVR